MRIERIEMSEGVLRREGRVVYSQLQAGNLFLGGGLLTSGIATKKHLFPLPRYAIEVQRRCYNFL